MDSPGSDTRQSAFRHQVASVLGERYRIEREVGSGATATVYLATDLKHDRRVAVKVLRPELSSTMSADRFEREVLIAAGLSHPNILSVHDSGASEGLLYYVMPFVEGETLAHRIERDGPLPLREAFGFARDIAAALQYAHDLGVVHRDIKPANVLLSHGVALVADFGLARAIRDVAGATQLTFAGVGLGTPSYMSPEQALGSATISGSADQYSLACVLFEMLTGRRPFEGGTFQQLLVQHATEPAPDPRTLRSEIDGAAAHAISKAMAKDPADRFPSVRAFIASATTESGTSAGPMRHPGRPWADRWRGRRSAILAGALAVAAAATFAWRRSASSAPAVLDRNLVAVAPFTAIEPQLAVWREGLADIIVHDLDGAGPLRTVATSIAAKGWNGTQDRTAIMDLGRRTGAGSVVSGMLLQSGPDSVRVTATVYDVASHRVIGEEIDLRMPVVRMDLLSERLAVAVLERLGQSKDVAEARLASAHAVPLAALKSFLQGEYFFRRTAWDSAMDRYQRAIQVDSLMALAYLRMSMVNGWQRFVEDSLTFQYAQKAEALNRHLAPRESLLIEAEALKARVLRSGSTEGAAGNAARLFTTLEDATRRYPDDRELWYSFGSALGRVGYKVIGALTALDRSIAIDSGFAPAYLDAVTLAMALGQTARARAYLSAYLALKPRDVHGDGLRLASMLLDGRGNSPEAQAILDTASADILVHAIDVVAYWPDSAETVIRLARLLAAGRPSPNTSNTDESFARFQLAYPLGFRGHLREAYETLGSSKFGLPESQHLLPATYVAAGAVPEPEAARFFAGTSRDSVDRFSRLAIALPWWSAHGDTSALKMVVKRAEAASRAGTSADTGRFARYLATAASAYLALAKGDSAAALTLLRTLGEGDCLNPYCFMEPLTTATLLASRRQYGEAMKILDDIPNVYSPLTVFWRLERARVAEHVGRLDEARSAYEYVASVWRNADPVLQPAVVESRAALRRLGAATQR